MRQFFLFFISGMLGIVLGLGALTACNHERDTLMPDDPVWTKAPAGCYEVEIKYECDCRDEVQAVITAAPADLPASAQPAQGRWIYFRKTQLGVERLPMGTKTKLCLLRYRAVKNYHATDLSHEYEEEFICEVAKCAQ